MWPFRDISKDIFVFVTLHEWRRICEIQYSRVSTGLQMVQRDETTPPPNTRTYYKHSLTLHEDANLPVLL